MAKQTMRERSILVPIVLLGISSLLPACGQDCSDAHDTAQAIRKAAEVDGIESRGICGLSNDEISALIDDAPAVPTNEKESRARQYHKACAEYRDSAGSCGDLGEDGDVG